VEGAVESIVASRISAKFRVHRETGREQEEGPAVIPFNSIDGGLLSGKYKRGDTPEKGRFSTELGGFEQAYLS
jgi:hypothetical protein